MKVLIKAFFNNAVLPYTILRFLGDEYSTSSSSKMEINISKKQKEGKKKKGHFGGFLYMYMNERLFSVMKQHRSNSWTIITISNQVANIRTLHQTAQHTDKEKLSSITQLPSIYHKIKCPPLILLAILIWPLS